MAKFTPSKKDVQEFRRLKTNGKRKYNRIVKKAPNAVNEMPEIYFPKNIHEFESRAQYNEWKETQRLFRVPNSARYDFVQNAYGTVSNRLRNTRIDRNTKKSQELAYEHIRRIESKVFYESGKETNSTVGQRMQQMARPSIAGIVPPTEFRFETIRSQRALDMREKRVKESADPRNLPRKTALMQKNFYELIEQVYGADGDHLISLLNKLDPDDFLRIYVQTSEFDFDLFYGKDGDITQHESAPLNRMVSYVERFLAGGYDKDLTNF